MRHAGPVVFVAPSPAGAVFPQPDDERAAGSEPDPETRFVQALRRVRAAKRRRDGDPPPEAPSAP